MLRLVVEAPTAMELATTAKEAIMTLADLVRVAKIGAHNQPELVSDYVGSISKFANITTNCSYRLEEVLGARKG